MVRAFTAEMIVETEIVIANWRKNCPLMPPRKQQGMNTEVRTRVMASTGPVISSMALSVAARASRPVAICRSMFSRTTMASSTTMPIASTRPKSVRLLSVNPIAAMIAKVPIKETGHVDHRQDHRLPVLEEHEHDDRHQDHRVAQRVEDLVDRLADEGRGVVNDLVIDEALGKAGLQLLHLGVHAGGRVQGVGPGSW